jgi:hypothetical protein
VAVDSDGNIYIADSSNCCIRKVNSAGRINMVAGNGISGYSGDGGPATSAQLSSAWDVALDSFGNIYIVDSSNYRIRKVNSAGIITTIAGNGSLGYSGDGQPAIYAQFHLLRGIALGSNGDIYIADTSNCCIRKIK